MKTPRPSPPRKCSPEMLADLRAKSRDARQGTCRPARNADGSALWSISTCGQRDVQMRIRGYDCPNCKRELETSRQRFGGRDNPGRLRNWRSP